MNIIIPIGGKGERFSKEGYLKPKPLISIFEKTMIEYVIDNLILNEDKVFIIYNYSLDNHNFSNYINNKYPYINLIKINDTKGAVETLFLGIDIILNNYIYYDKSLILDCDTFYTEDICYIFKNSENNMVFFTKNYDTNPIYSYIELNNDLTIINIEEKKKISDNANTGAYAFIDIKILYNYCKYVLDNNITFNNEPYTSCVISEMIKQNILFKGYELKEEYVFSVGTPKALTKYINNTYAFIFNLDETLVIIDNIYFDVWYEILIEYNIILNKDIYCKYIKGNNDEYILNTLLHNIKLSIDDLSKLKDSLFIKNIHKIKIIDGIYDIINKIKLLSYKICIVTNFNKNITEEIIKYINLYKFIDFIKYEPYCEQYNNAIDKCFIFEDSKSDILNAKNIYPKLLIDIETTFTPFHTTPVI